MLKYEKFKQTILHFISTSELDVGMVFFILKDITQEIERLYLQKVQEEAQSEAKEEQSE